MSNVLLVDDELLVVQALKEKINWESCGVEQVFLCDNAQTAKNIVENNDIQLVISDIEMPGIGGIEFAGWLKEKYSDVRVIFLTGYAEFEYAKAAVALQAEDYILKPVDSGLLEKKILDVIKKVEFARREQEMKERYSMRSGELLSEFVRYATVTEETPRGDKLREVFERYQLDFGINDYFILILIHFSPAVKRDWEKAQNFKQMITDGFNGLNSEVYISGIDDRKMTVCIRFASTENVRMDAMREKLLSIITEDQVSCSCFITELLNCEQICPMLRKLAAKDEKNVLYQNRVVLVGHRNLGQENAGVEIDYKQWAMHLANGELDKLFRAIDFSVHSVVISGNMDAQVLRNIYNNFMQIMYHYIGENPFIREQIVADEQLETVQKKALNSVEEFREFVECFIDRIRMIIRIGSAEDVSNKVKKYIDEHLSEKVSRTEIADYVALSENYLSRLFHKENGCSISDYILQKRMNMAKKLLVQTKLPVSAIGEQVGYETTTYFIRVFKREIGMTPKDYRKEMKL